MVDNIVAKTLAGLKAITPNVSVHPTRHAFNPAEKLFYFIVKSP
jgi:hypothetical protein